ncbi:MAG: hypothetical protein PHF86_12815 [Candidatus Nanoarchaeia archaeon]|nr:hypothetical protein [Candidatus Nanoarchaeia archaeon]
MSIFSFVKNLFFKKKIPELPELSEPSRPNFPEQPLNFGMREEISDNSNDKMDLIKTKLDLVNSKLDNIDRRLMDLERLAEEK